MSTQFRQHPGAACEECRRRKARCDRARPRCGTCSVLDKVCVFNEQRTQRGPKKGQIRALRERVHTLERLLAEPQHVGVSFRPEIDHAEPQSMLDVGAEATDLPTDVQPLWGIEPDLSTAVEPWIAEMGPFGGQCSSSPDSNWRSGHASSEDHGTILMQDDLIAVYFERVHPNIPIIHKLRYFDMLEHQSPSPSQRCLQLAIQATAAASTAQTLMSSHLLYAEACTALDAVEINGPISRANTVPVQLEYIQALLLVVYYEILRMPQDKYVLTAGRAFRLVQIARLHEVDISTFSNHECAPGEFARQETRRRTFWAAYCCDRLLSIRHELPHTLHDVATHTRLPAPESHFQDDNPVCMPFLSDVMSSPGTILLPVFAEGVVLATLLGKSMLLRGAPPSRLGNVAAKLQDLRVCLHNRLQIMGTHLPRASASVDPPLGFAHILAYSLIINLNEITDSMPLMKEHRSPAESLDAYREILALAKSSCRGGRFKTNIFLPVLLARAINFKASRQQNDDLNELMDILQRLSYVNRQAEELVQELVKHQ